MEGLIILAVTFGLMWVLFIVPRQRQLRAHQQLVASIEAGDEIVTGGGIFGTVVAVDDEVVTLRVADGVDIRVARAAVLRRTSDLAEREVDEQHADSPVDPTEPTEPT